MHSRMKSWPFLLHRETLDWDNIDKRAEKAVPPLLGDSRTEQSSHAPVRHYRKPPPPDQIVCAPTTTRPDGTRRRRGSTTQTTVIANRDGARVPPRAPR